MAKKQASSTRKRAAKAEKRAMTVTFSGNRPIHEVTNDLKAAGFEVGQVLEAIGSVTGFAHPKLKKQLKSIPGVAHVEDDHPPIDIGPPGAPVS